MSYDYVDIGPVPYMENAAQIPRETELNVAECRIYKAQLERQYPVPEGINAFYTIKANPHDFGTYREVGIKYDDNDELACDWAWKIQDNSPANWDEQARTELEQWKAAHPDRVMA